MDDTMASIKETFGMCGDSNKWKILDLCEPIRPKLTDEQLRDVGACMDDSSFFINKRIYLSNVANPMNETQEIVVENFDNEDAVLIRLPRQSGASSICAAYALWTAMFSGGVLVHTINHITNKLFIKKVSVMYQSLPKWMRDEFPLGDCDESNFLFKWDGGVRIVNTFMRNMDFPVDSVIFDGVNVDELKKIRGLGSRIDTGIRELIEVVGVMSADEDAAERDVNLIAMVRI